MKKQTKNNFKKIQIFAAVSLLFFSTLMLFNNSDITGHFTADFTSQILDLRIEKSQSFEISTNTKEEIVISSLRLSGSIIGKGSVEIFIEDNGQRFLIYSNVMEKEQGLPTITGMSIVQAAEEAEETAPAILLNELKIYEWDSDLTLAATEEFAIGPFNNKCVDTCFMEMPVSSEETYELIFMVQPGTILDVTKITYTIKNENIG